MLKAYGKKELPEPTLSEDRSPEYWAHRALASYQRYYARRFKDIFERIRESRWLSQTELAERSGVDLRNIQMYEQRGNNIDKAQAEILCKLSRVLGCDVEGLLENPMF